MCNKSSIVSYFVHALLPFPGNLDLYFLLVSSDAFNIISLESMNNYYRSVQILQMQNIMAIKFQEGSDIKVDI